MIENKFGRLTVLEEFKKHNGKRNVAHFKCVCVCGTVKVINAQHVKRGKIVSCGCYNKERVIETKTKHGMYGTRFYKCWVNILKRCNYERNSDFDHYGGRGINVCNQWDLFETFYEDMYVSYLEHVNTFGEKNTSLIRKDVNGNYDPDNTKWATMSAQNSNRRLNKNNTSGSPGVHLLKSGNWMVKVNGRYLGTLNNKRNAIIARKIGEKKFNHKRG